MKKTHTFTVLAASLLAVTTLAHSAPAADAEPQADALRVENYRGGYDHRAIEALKAELAKFRREKRLEQEHLTNFDDLDFNVFSNQKWDELHHSHAQNIVVHWPDGRTTTGISTHIEDLKALFVYAPDIRIKQHPIRIASGDWTAVSGVMEGTFTQPMPLPDGRLIPPTGKSFKLPMVTLGHWKNGTMDEETLSWDNQSFLQQIGLAP